MLREVFNTIKGPLILLSIVGFVLGLLVGLGVQWYFIAPVIAVALFLFWAIGCLLYMKFFDSNI